MPKNEDIITVLGILRIHLMRLKTTADTYFATAKIAALLRNQSNLPREDKYTPRILCFTAQLQAQEIILFNKPIQI